MAVSAAVEALRKAAGVADYASGPAYTSVANALAGTNAYSSIAAAQAAMGINNSRALSGGSGSSGGSGGGYNNIVPTAYNAGQTAADAKKNAVISAAIQGLGNNLTATMQNGHGYINGQPITSVLPGIQWVSTKTIQPGGAYGYYTYTGTSTPTVQDKVIEQPQTIDIPSILNEIRNIPQAPTLNYDFTSKAYTPPNYSITSNPADTSFIPTSKAIDRMYNAQKDEYSQALQNYNNELSNWQNKTNTLLSLLSYTTLTAAQQAEIDNQNAQNALKLQIEEAERKAEAEKTAEEARRWQAEYDLKKRETDYSTNKPYYKPDSGGSGNTNNYTSSKIAEAASEHIRSNLSKYKRPLDYIAQVRRNMESGKISAAVGNAILEMMQQMYPTDTSLTKTLSTWKG